MSVYGVGVVEARTNGGELVVAGALGVEVRDGETVAAAVAAGV
jgi:hypothetical protein